MQFKSETLSVVILSWNTSELTRKCLRSLASHGGKYPLEIIVVDNASGDGSVEDIEREFPDIRLFKNEENRLYAAANNQGVAVATGEWLNVLNSDTEVTPGALDKLVDFLKANKDYIIASPQLLNFDGSIQKACNDMPPLYIPLLDNTFLKRTKFARRIVDKAELKHFSHDEDRDVFQPPGTCLVMKTEDYRQLGGMDETLSLYFNDVDFSRRAWAAGRKTRFISSAKVYHHEGASTSKSKNLTMGNPLYFINRSQYYHKWHGFVGRGVNWFATFLLLLELLGRSLLGKKKWRQKWNTVCKLVSDFSYISRKSGYFHTNL